MARIYATDAGNTITGNPSNLYWIDPATGVATLIGSIGFNDVLSMAYDFDTGTLYGIDRSSPPHLIAINKTTGAGTLVTNLFAAVPISGAIIVGGQMYGWNEVNVPQDFLARINMVSGEWQNVGPSGVSIDRDALAYDPTTRTAYVKGGNAVYSVSLTTGATSASPANFTGGAVMHEGFTFSPSGVPYAQGSPTGGGDDLLITLATPFVLGGAGTMLSLAPTGLSGTRYLVGHSWVPDAYIAPIVKPVPPTTGAAPQTPCAPKSELSNGGKGKFGCNNGGVGWTSSYAGPYGTVPDHEDPPDGELMTGKEHAGVEVWLRWYHRDYPTGVVTMRQRALVELADPPDYEFGRKEDGLLSVGDIEHAIGNEQGGFEASTVDLQLSDAVDRTVRVLLEDQDLEGDEVSVLMASDAARGAA